MNQGRKRTSDEPWFKKTVAILRKKPIWEEQIKILQGRLDDATPNCIAQHSLTPGGSDISDQTGNIGLRRAEWQREIREREGGVREILSAMTLLTDEQKTIIELRYFKDLRDWHIYDLSKLPVGKTLYYQLRDDAVRIMAECLGMLETAVKLRSTK